MNEKFFIHTLVTQQENKSANIKQEGGFQRALSIPFAHGNRLVTYLFFRYSHVTNTDLYLKKDSCKKEKRQYCNLLFCYLYLDLNYVLLEIALLII